MCGIIGFTGNDAKQTVGVLTRGLQKLEYRGYDSAGIYINDDSNATNVLVKAKGRVQVLVDKVAENDIQGKTGIAHTRWATHGGVTEENTHPHFSDDERFYLVHNGVIENYKELTAEYLSDIKMHSETDTEVAVQLVGKFAKDGMTTLDAFKKMISLLDPHSAYAFLMMDRDDPDSLYVAKQKSPLLIGVGKDLNLVTSDAAAVLDLTKNFLELNDGEVAVVKQDSVQIFDQNGDVVDRQPFTVDIDVTDTDKGVYPFYMLKEIDEQPVVARKLSQYYLNEDGTTIEEHLPKEIIEAIKQADRLYIVAAGTSYHAGLVGKTLFEKWANKPTEVHVSSEFAYNQPLLAEKPFFIFLSQSGETADSREVLQNIKEQGFPTLTLANVVNSTLTREADYSLPLLAGPETAVASTKAYTAQVIAEAVLAVALAQSIGEKVINLHEELAKIAVDMQTVIDEKETFKKIADELLVPKTVNRAFYIGRGVDAAMSLEASLKLKEISYVQTEGFAAGELKHGTISLIEEGTPVFALVTQKNTAGLTRSNLIETQARGAKAVVITTEDYAKEGDQIVLPNVIDELSPLLSVLPAQLLAYYASLGKGYDVDHPRNLAKSVTVQ